MFTITTHHKEETQHVAQTLASLLKTGETFVLLGDLAAGKTTFTQGLAKGLDIKTKVNSPTFVIMKEYEGRIPLVHIDAYRLEGLDQDLGFEDYSQEEVVKVVEWPQYLFDSLIDKNIISLSVLDENSREIEFNFVNKELEEKLKEALSC